MTTEWVIWRAAVSLIESYGADAALVAGDRADELTACGRIPQSEIWQRILATIEKVQAEEPRGIA
jgi:hypothetical protein